MNQERIIKEVEDAVVKLLRNGDGFKIDYSSRINLDKDVGDLYSKLDWERILGLVKAKVEESIAEKIVNNFATEIGTDIKSIYQNKNLREDMRYAMRKNLELVMYKVSEGVDK